MTPSRSVFSDPERVTATPRALELIERLRRRHGELVFFQSGGCCAGSDPMCLHAGELPPGPNDVRIGTVGGAAFYIDAEQDRRWNEPHFVLDVRPGTVESFSLEGAEGVHFVSGAPADAGATH